MNSVEPATSSRLSRLPAWRPGGLLLTRPSSGAGATPMLPKNAQRAVAVLRHDPAAAVVAVVEREIDGENPDLQHVARLGTLDINRPSQDVPARPAAVAGDLRDHPLQRLLN